MTTSSPRQRTAPALGPAALYYASTYHWPVFPLHSAKGGRCSCERPDCGNVGKHPRTEHGFHDASRSPDVIQAWWRRWPDANIGIATGRVSGLLVLDVDPRNGGDDRLEDIVAQHGPLPFTVESLTGGGGYHYLFAYPPELPPEQEIGCGKLLPGIDIKADGGYIVAPPSVHGSGKPYAWEASSRPGEVPLAAPPPWLIADRATTPHKYDGPPGELDRCFLFLAFAAAGWVRRRIDDDRAAVSCPWANEHTGGRDGDTSTVLFAPTPGHSLGWFHCSHSHCGGRTVEDIKRALPPDAVTAAKAAQRPAPPPAAEAAAEPAPPAPAPAPADWRTLVSRSKSGEAKNTYGNVCLVLRNTYGSRLTYNEMRLSPILDGVPLVDPDIGRVREELERAWGMTPSAENTAQAIRQVSGEQSFHPVRDYLTGLTWDGVCRIERVAADVLGADPSPLTVRMLRAWFVSAVARAMRPGCKVDTALVLVGPQGYFKSTFFSVLGGQWFSDTAMDISNKDSLLQLAFAWIYEWPELENVTSRKQASEVKAFTTSRADTFRPPFGRGVIQHPRGTVIVGTTNEEQFLADATGSRRFWVIRITKRIDASLLASLRDQLWAEAVALFTSNYAWWLEHGEEEEREEAAEEHRVDDALDGVIASWAYGSEARRLVTERATPLQPGYITTRDILEKGMKLDFGKWDRGTQTRVGIAMRRLKWAKARPSIRGLRDWVYYPPGGYE